jgi:hypothetical protein
MEKESHELLPLTRQMASGSIRNKESRRPSGLHLNQSATAGRRECTGAKRGDRQNYAVLNRRSHYCLLKADGDQQTDANRSNVDEEVFPGMNCLVRWMYVEHGCRVLLNGFGCTHRLRIDFGRGWCGNRANGCIGRYISRSSFRAVLLHYLTASLTAI